MSNDAGQRWYVWRGRFTKSVLTSRCLNAWVGADPTIITASPCNITARNQYWWQWANPSWSQNSSTGKCMLGSTPEGVQVIQAECASDGRQSRRLTNSI